MRLVVAADHAGFDLKRTISDDLMEAGHEIIDAGAYEKNPDDDYPDFAVALGRIIQGSEAERGILICGSGVGASIAANKLPGVRAGLCHDTYSAHQGVEHDDMNVLVIGSRIIGEALARELVHAFTAARFSNEERHRRRLDKVRALETNLTV
jgi:RpiB/LacA/LacB family sugar-phosphate isomerase